MASLGSEVTANQAVEFINKLGCGGFTKKRLIEVLSNDDLAARWVERYPEAVSEVKSETRWSQLRNAMGIPDKNIWSEFTEEHFPLSTKPAYEYDLEVIHFDRELNDKELLAEIKKLGAELPEPEDGMMYAASHPNEPRKYPIVVRLARPWINQHGDAYVFYFCSSGNGRVLYGIFVYRSWVNRCRFLVRRPRKSKQS
jgi:hypothetical protein